MYNTKRNIHRGFHAHKNLEQILICIHGSCKILLDNGKGEKKVVSLEKPYEGLFIPHEIWREMYDFSSDCCIACACIRAISGKKTTLEIMMNF